MSELYDTLMFGARKLNRDERLNLILGCVPDDKKMAVLEALGYKMTILNPDKEDAPEEPKGSALDLMILTLTDFIANEPDENKVDLEDCKRMLEKLKAWKRLENKGFRFVLDGETPRFVYHGADGERCIKSAEESKQCRADVRLLFGDEE